jgi:putative hydrolase of the HAD superfamily
MRSDFIDVRGWDNIKLVVFDVDGTLYRGQSLRLRMAREMLLHAFLNLNFEIITVLKTYRRIRERLGDEEVPNFENALIAETAAITAHSPDVVQATVTEWIEQRPLRHLAQCRYPLISELFAGLRREGKIIGILSDYPATAKLAALGLTANHVVCAGDKSIGRLKPHPRGLEVLIAAAGMQASETVVVGDRVERDGLVARRVGAQALIMSLRPIKGFQTFARFDDALWSRFHAALIVPSNFTTSSNASRSE